MNRAKLNHFLMTTALVACSGSLTVATQSTGWANTPDLPSLESSTSSLQTMTPLSELMAPTANSAAEKTSAEVLKNEKISTESPVKTSKIKSREEKPKKQRSPGNRKKQDSESASSVTSVAQDSAFNPLEASKHPESNHELTLEADPATLTASVNHTAQPAIIKTAMATENMSPPAINAIDPSTPGDAPKVKQPKHLYKALPAMVVFPVLHHVSEKAFGDAAIVFANGFSERLEKQFPDTRIHNPVYSMETLKLKGLSRMYKQMMDYYVQAGRPEPRALAYLLSELSVGGPEIQRAIFVEADVDLYHLNRSWRPKDVLKKYHSDSLPTEQRYYVKTHISVYDTHDTDHPRLWSHQWAIPIKTTGIYNVTASVFQDSDSLAYFSEAARNMGRLSLIAVPRDVYMTDILKSESQLQGEVVNDATTGDPLGKISDKTMAQPTKPTLSAELKKPIKPDPAPISSPNLTPMKVKLK